MAVGNSATSSFDNSNAVGLGFKTTLANQFLLASQIFAGLRESRVDLSTTLLLAPTFFEAPRQLQENVFNVKGVFQLRPVAIQFDLYYQWEQGRWKLLGIDIRPLAMAQSVPGPAVQAPPATAPAPRRR